jgi:hypothetical protein
MLPLVRLKCSVSVPFRSHDGSAWIVRHLHDAERLAEGDVPAVTFVDEDKAIVASRVLRGSRETALWYWIEVLHRRERVPDRCPNLDRSCPAR